MKQLIKVLILTALSLTLLANTGLALAQEGSAPERRPGGGALWGQVTAVGDASLTAETRAGRSVTVNVTGETKIWLIGDGEGSLSDIQVGRFVGVRGRRNEPDSVQARLILVLSEDPATLAKILGKVTGIDGQVIEVATRRGSLQVITNDETEFKVGRAEGSLADVEVGRLVFVLGSKPENGSLTAKLVVVAPGAPRHPRALRGEVLSVDAEAGAFTLQSRQRGEFTILTDGTTRYRTRGDGEAGFEDIEAGSKVIVLGRPVAGQEKTVQAKLVGILPADGSDN